MPGIGAPRLGLAEPEDEKRRLVAGGFVALLHGALLATLLALAALAPPEFVERVIPVALIPIPKAVPDPVTAELPGSNLEPAPVGPKQVGARRANAAELAASQILTPSQAAAMRREALDAARREIEQMNVDAAVAPSMPTQVARREIRADTVTARDAAVVAPNRAVDVQAVKPVKIDPADLAATPRDLAGPRAIDPASLTNLSRDAALTSLGSPSDLDTARYEGAVEGGPTGGIEGAGSAGRVAVGIDTGIAGAFATGGGSGGPGTASGSGSGTNSGHGPGTGGGGDGTGGTGEALGTVRCLESAAVQRYLDRVQQRTSQRWRVPDGVPENTAVVLRFELDAAGMANRVESQRGEGDSSALANSARQALLSAAPFSPLDASNRCLTDKRIVLTFTVPTR